MTDREIWRIKKAADYERFKPARSNARRLYMQKWRKQNRTTYNRIKRDCYHRMKSKPADVRNS